jgi:lysozyme family protein
MTAFDQAFKDLVDIEKGFSDDPKDPGNWTGGKVNVGQLNGTIYGISAAAYPKLKIVTLSLAAAKDLYLSDYWDQCKCDALPDPVAAALFKMAVNLGNSGAIKAFQKSLGVEVDGNIGPLTIGNASRLPPTEVIEDFLTQCAEEYIHMDNFSVDGVGWMRRLIKIGLQADVAP